MYRQILDNPISKRPDYCHVWTILLLLAQHEPSDYIWNGEKKRLEAGQLMTGRKSLSVLCGLHESKIQRILNFLEIEQQIEQQKTNRFRIITIKNWEKYQGMKNDEQQLEQPVNNQRTTSEQPVNTYKNVKKDKNENNEKKQIVSPNEFSTYWNTKRLTKISVFNEQRKRQLKIRSGEQDFFDRWRIVIDKMDASDFCLQGKWATVDWVLKNSTNYVKVLEGNYDNKAAAKPAHQSGPRIPNAEETARINEARRA